MKWLASLGGVIGIQAIGSIATLTSVMLIARERGPAIQGTFGLVKAEVDLLAALLLVGMPQAIFYYLSRGGLSWQTVRRLTIIQSSVTALISIFLLYGRHPGEWGWSPGLLGGSIAAAALVAHGNLRGGILCTASEVVFSAVTALPGLSLLFSVLVALALGALTTVSFSNFGLLLACANGAACLITLLAIRPGREAEGHVQQPVSTRALLKYGFATWVPAVGQTLSPVIALGWIHTHMGDAVGVGVFSAAIMSMNIVLTPFAMLIPLLFKRWVNLEGESRRTDLRRAATWLAPICAGFACLVYVLQDPLVGSLFGPEYVARGSIFALMALAIWPQMMNRLLGVAFSAQGRPWLALLGEIARVGTLAGGLRILDVRDLVALAAVWVFAEYLSPAIGWLVGQGPEHPPRPG